MPYPRDQLFVEVVGGKDRGRRLVFDAPGDFVLGRAGTPDLYLALLTDASLRSRHLTVRAAPSGGIVIEDLGSGGLTRVSGKSVGKVRVSSGALVEAGDCVLRLVLVQGNRLTCGVPLADLGDYEIHEEIGRGAFSRVYVATETASGKKVAIKRLLLQREQHREILVSSFLREIETVARLQHPGIAAVHAAGRRRDDMFIVLEYVDGPDLDACVRIDGPLPIHVVTEVGTQILEALAHAHGRGVIHRDIKPSNVVVGGVPRKLQTVLVDFGLAIDMSGDVAWGLTRTGDLRGTPDYLAPECLLDVRGHSVRSDLFAVGAALFFALTGRPCRHREAGEAMTADSLLRAPLLRLGDLRPAVDPGLACVIERALLRDAEDRWPNCAEMLAALLGWSREASLP